MAKKQKNKKQKKEKKKGSILKIVFGILSILLFLFLIIKWFMFTTEWFPKLHFCNYLMNLVFSFIFLGFAVIFVLLFFGKKKTNKIWLIIFGVVIIVGIILMNLIACNISGGVASLVGFDMSWIPFFEAGEDYRCNSGVDCPGDIVEVPVPPCAETDDGQDYITFGTILSGADLDDICMGTVLRERYCYDELHYTSEDIDCIAEFGDTWTCIEGECRDTGEVVDEELEACYQACYDEIYDYCVLHSEGEGSEEYTYCMASFGNDLAECENACDVGEVVVVDDDDDDDVENTAELCSDTIDNDADSKVDCLDEECIEFCECVYDGVFPECLGYVDEGYICAPTHTSETDGWCVAMPEEEIACYGSGMIDELFCSGWCDTDMYCVHIGTSCYCSSWACLDTDDGYDIYTPGVCIGESGTNHDSCAGDVLTEYQCLGTCTAIEEDCEEVWEGRGICEVDKNGVGYCMEEVL